MTKNLVSIVIPCYSMGRYILEALESISAQTYTNWEILAVDDLGPKDGTEEIVLAFAKNHPTHRIEFIKHTKNKGVSAARNKGIKNAKGNFIALLDPDDFWLPEHLEKAVSKFKSDEDLYFYSSYAFIFYGQNKEVIASIEGYKDWEILAFPYILSLKNAIPASSSVLRATVFNSVLLFDEHNDIQHAEDYDLWIRIIEKKLKAHINTEPTIYYRKHVNGATSNYNLMTKAKLAIAKKHKDFLVLYQREALEILTNKLYSFNDSIIRLRAQNSDLNIRLMVLEQTVLKFKSLPIIKQFLILKKIIRGR